MPCLCDGNWSKDSGIEFNLSKREFLMIFRHKTPFQINYHLGPELKRVVSEVDVQITATSNLSWNSHIKDLDSKGNKMFNLLRRTRSSLTDHTVRDALYLPPPLFFVGIGLNLIIRMHNYIQRI